MLEGDEARAQRVRRMERQAVGGVCCVCALAHCLRFGRIGIACRNAIMCIYSVVCMIFVYVWICTYTIHEHVRAYMNASAGMHARN